MLCDVFLNMYVILKRQYFFREVPFERFAQKESDFSSYLFFLFHFFLRPLLSVISQHELSCVALQYGSPEHNEVSVTLPALLFAAVCLPFQFVKLTRTYNEIAFYGI